MKVYFAPPYTYIQVVYVGLNNFGLVMKKFSASLLNTQY